jgi:hypothetical protein
MKTMRSFHLQYLGYVLVGVGSGLSISGLVTFIYFQQRYWIISQYRSISLPLLIIGICIVAAGIMTFRKAKEKGRQEIEGEKPPIYLPAPPPPPPPPPP